MDGYFAKDFFDHKKPNTVLICAVMMNGIAKLAVWSRVIVAAIHFWVFDTSFLFTAGFARPWPMFPSFVIQACSSEFCSFLFTLGTIWGFIYRSCASFMDLTSYASFRIPPPRPLRFLLSPFVPTDSNEREPTNVITATCSSFAFLWAKLQSTHRLLDLLKSLSNIYYLTLNFKSLLLLLLWELSSTPA